MSESKELSSPPSTDQPADPEKTLASIPVNRRLIDELYHAGCVDERTRHAGLALVMPAPPPWHVWLSRILLLAGLSLLISGVFFFFAFNWWIIPDFGKLGGVAFVLLMTTAIAAFLGLQKTAGQVLLLMSSLLVGVFLAIFGQVYQTGANAWQLFAGWTGLITGWVLIAKFPAQWLLWLILANMTALFFYAQTGWSFLLNTGQGGLHIFLIGLNGVALLIREYMVKKGQDWLAPIWTRWVVVFPLLFMMLIPILYSVFDMFYPEHIEVEEYIATGFAVIAMAGFYLFYSHHSADRVALAGFLICVFIITVYFLGEGMQRIIYLLSPGADRSYLFILASETLLSAFAMVAWWRHILRITQHQQVQND